MPRPLPAHPRRTGLPGAISCHTRTGVARMDFRIGTEQREMVAAVRDLAQTEFKPNAGRYMDGTFPWDNMKSLAAMGVLGMTVPEEYGGLGLAGFYTPPILQGIGKVWF